MQPKLRFKCPYCGAKLSISPERAGERLPCPKCRCDIDIPAPDYSAVPGAIEVIGPPLPITSSERNEQIPRHPYFRIAHARFSLLREVKQLNWLLLLAIVCIAAVVIGCVLFAAIAHRTEPIQNVPVVEPQESISEFAERAQRLENAINALLESGQSDARVTCSHVNGDRDLIELDGIKCFGFADYSEGNLAAIEYRFPLSGLIIQDMKAGFSDFTEIFRVLLASFTLLCANQQEDYDLTYTLSSWLGPDPFMFLANQRSRAFGNRIVAGIDNEKGISVFYATTLETDQTLQAAREATSNEYITAMERAESAKTWQEMQTALRGTEGYCTLPDLGAATAGRISIGDSMRDVASRLSIRGSEVSNFEGRMFQVKWENDTGMILLTFERGRVSQKMSR